jgi:DNA-binding NarL/FixJ family response regulator
MKIIIADDSSLFRDRIRELLENINNVEIVGEAENGLEALQFIKDKKPDLAILDVRMPDMNGIEVLKKVRENGSRIIICMLTNYPYKQYRQKCIAEGSDYFFDKNLDIKQISDVITKLAKNQKGD